MSKLIQSGRRLGLSMTMRWARDPESAGCAAAENPGQVILTQRIPSAVGYPVFSGAIDAMLAAANAKP